MADPTDQSSREQEPQLVRVVNKTDYLAIEDTRTGEELRCFSLRELAIAALFVVALLFASPLLAQEAAPTGSGVARPALPRARRAAVHRLRRCDPPCRRRRAA